MDRNLALEMVRATEAAALAVSKLMGRGDERAADEAAASAMRDALSEVAIDGTVVIGEGSEGEAKVLYMGERLGTGQGPVIDLALDPLEGATIAAKGGDNALSVVAVAGAGGFLRVPDMYMEKIAVGEGFPDDVVSLDAEPGDNLRALARAAEIDVGDLVVCVLDRPRHRDLIAKVRKAGARVRLIDDGDVSAAIATAQPDSGIDVYMGIGGAQQGILAAAALRCLGGQMQGRLVFRSPEDRRAAQALGITDHGRIYRTGDMADGDVMFAATGVTDGAMLSGVRRFAGGALTHSLVMRLRSGTLRYIEARHHFADKKNP